MNREQFFDEVNKLGIKLTPEMINQFDVYLDFLKEYNSHTNLTAIKSDEDIYLKHFYDSLTIARVIDLSKESSLLDIGSGAGFPGMVLKIVYPHLHVVLVDSNNKKTKFLGLLVDKLNVTNIEIINDRIEKIYDKFLNKIDVVTARAVTNLSILVELALPVVATKKFFIAMKGSNDTEIEDGRFAIEQMHGKIVKLDKFLLSEDAGYRNLLLVEKFKDTIFSEIRPYEKIVKKPLQK